MTITPKIRGKIRGHHVDLIIMDEAPELSSEELETVCSKVLKPRFKWNLFKKVKSWWKRGLFK